MSDVELLQDCYAEKLAAILRHEAGARLIRQYDANNTYQYIINREETQLSWLGREIVELGASVPAQPSPQAEGAQGRTSPKGASDEPRRVLEQDVREADGFVERWRPRIEQFKDTRHRGTLRVIIGETLEQKRFFEQALAGDVNLLGKRTDHVGPRVGEVLPTRWIE